MKRSSPQHDRNLSQATYERQIILIVKTGKSFTPGWAGKRPGEDPRLPLRPPGAKP